MTWVGLGVLVLWSAPVLLFAGLLAQPGWTVLVVVARVPLVLAIAVACASARPRSSSSPGWAPAPRLAC